MNKFEMVLKTSSEENKRKEKERSDWEANNWREFIDAFSDRQQH